MTFDLGLDALTRTHTPADEDNTGVSGSKKFTLRSFVKTLPHAVSQIASIRMRGINTGIVKQNLCPCFE